MPEIAPETGAQEPNDPLQPASSQGQEKPAAFAAAHSHSHPQSDFAVRLGTWIHDHKHATSDNLFGYTTYQYLRSCVASVPYGLSMAGTWLAFDKTAKWSAGKPGLKYLNMYAASPLMRLSAMIGTSFSLYRATSKIGKWVNEHLFDPEDSLETTIDKVEHLPESLKRKVDEVYLPEFHSTLVSSMVLGGLVHAGNMATTLGDNGKHFNEAMAKTKEMLGGHFSFNSKAWGHFWKEAIANPKANFIPQAAIYSLGYSLFFELGDRRFKDKQMSRGLWAGRSDRIGSGSKSNPSLLQEPLHPEDESAPQQPEDGSTHMLGELPEGSRMNDTLSVLTSEPSVVRWFGRRFIPTAISITAYTALKFRAGQLFFGKFPDPEKMNSVGGFLTNAWREGANTTQFFMIPFVSDKYAPAFDNFVNRLEAKVSGRSYEDVIAGYQPKRAASIRHSHIARAVDAGAPDTPHTPPHTPDATVREAETQARIAEPPQQRAGQGA